MEKQKTNKQKSISSSEDLRREKFIELFSKRSNTSNIFLKVSEYYTQSDNTDSDIQMEALESCLPLAFNLHSNQVEVGLLTPTS